MGSPPPKTSRLRARQALFVLPNGITLAGMACGFWAVVSLAEGAPPETAAWAIFAAMSFDLFDGRVARLTRTQSEFGTQLDSLADLVSFGLAPALLMFRIMEPQMGPVAFAVAMAYAAAAALRLARFNVLARAGPSKDFLGLPSPVAAATVVATTLGWESLTPLHSMAGPWVSLGALSLAALMVSSIRYRSFKRMNPVEVLLVLLVLGGAALSSVPTTPKTALLVAVGSYVLLGPAEALARLLRGNREPHLAAGGEQAASDSVGRP